VYGYAATAEGLNSGWAALGTWTVSGPQPPQVLSVTPSSGSGSSQTFSFVFSAPLGAADLNSLITLINSALSGTSGCYVQVDPVHNLLWLANDSATTWGSGIAFGSSNTVQNSQCAVSGAGSNIQRSGNNLTLNLAVSFQAGFTGAKNVYGYAATAEGLNSGWKTVGNWVP